MDVAVTRRYSVPSDEQLLERLKAAGVSPPASLPVPVVAPSADSSGTTASATTPRQTAGADLFAFDANDASTFARQLLQESKEGHSGDVPGASSASTSGAGAGAGAGATASVTTNGSVGAQTDNDAAAKDLLELLQSETAATRAFERTLLHSLQVPLREVHTSSA